MPKAELRVFTSAEAIAEELAPQLLERIESARNERRRFLLGCPTGRTPQPVYSAMARQLAATQQDISNLVIVLMDEYLVPDGQRFKYADAKNAWTCHHFARARMADRWNEVLPQTHHLRQESIWFPDPDDPASYDAKIGDEGGIDFFMLASGATDGHVAFNPPGSPRDSRTRIIELPDTTRRDNLRTFPEFGSLSAVPTHGISVGIATITAAKEAAMLLWGKSKLHSLRRITETSRYESDWPATVIHECAGGRILSDAAP